MKPDPHAFTNSAEMGEVVPPQPRTYARYALLDGNGEVVPVGLADPIPLDVWRHVVDPVSRQPTGYVRRERMRRLGEVFQELHRRLDTVVCDRCAHERPRREGEYGASHEGCGGDYRWFLDEYLHGPEREGEPVPWDYRWVACFPVTGASEGHYVHVDFVVPQDNGDVRLVRLALGKTFQGMDHAAQIAWRCALLLGA